MADTICFIKVSKKDGFVKDGWCSFGYIESCLFLYYLVAALGIPTLNIGDSAWLLSEESSKCFNFKTKEDIDAYELVLDNADLETDEEIYYRLTQNRIKEVFDYFKKWSKGKSEDEIKEMQSFLDYLKELISKVDFETENLFCTLLYA